MIHLVKWLDQIIEIFVKDAQFACREDPVSGQENRVLRPHSYPEDDVSVRQQNCANVSSDTYISCMGIHYPSSISSAIHFSPITVSTSSLPRKGAIGLASSC